MARQASKQVVVAKDLGIRFQQNRRRKLRVREYLIKGRTTTPPGQFWALRKVSFTINQGEAVGLVGGNGHGKSTLLKLIAGVMLPDEGRVRVDRGGVAPMIEVTGGFSGDLTVRENIWLAAGLHGMTKAQIAARFDGIAEWAEITQRLDSPFRHLSSGMKAKVGFSVITTIDRPIVLIDEVLAVGDRAFRQKCFVRMEELLGNGKTVLLVSHSVRHLQRFCTRGLYLRHGELVRDGPIEDVLTHYTDDSDRGMTADATRRAAPSRDLADPDDDE